MSKKKQYTFRWKEYRRNFPQRFLHFLEKEEFVDVALVTEGHSVMVHRVILSAVSPYFYAMFSVSQKPFVMLDNDITSRSMEYLIGYIYSGKVNVKRRDLKDFLRAAKLLRIQGIDGIDETSDLNNSLSVPSNSIPIQQTIAFEDPNTVNLNEEENLKDPGSDHNFDDINFTPDSREPLTHDKNETQATEEEESYCTCECPCPDETNIDNEQSQSVCTNVTCPTKKFNDANQELDLPSAKRTRTESNELNAVADISVSENNKENLIHNGFKFSKKLETLGCTFWQCSLRDSNHKCRANVYTKMNDGAMIMKVSRAASTQPLNDENIDDFNITADIRLSRTNKVNLFYDHYKFYKYNSNEDGSDHWHCSKAWSKIKCNATAHTRMVKGVMMMKMNQARHTHSPSDKVDIDDLNIVADIRRNDRNFENLYHDGYKFSIDSFWESSADWRCTMYYRGSNCRARAMTTNVNGTIMVTKLFGRKHNHERKAN